MDYWNFSEPFTFRPLSQDEKSSDFQPHVWAATHFKGIWLTEWDPEDDEQIGILWRAAENNILSARQLYSTAPLLYPELAGPLIHRQREFFEQWRILESRRTQFLESWQELTGWLEQEFGADSLQTLGIRASKKTESLQMEKSDGGTEDLSANGVMARVMEAGLLKILGEKGLLPEDHEQYPRQTSARREWADHQLRRSERMYLAVAAQVQDRSAMEASLQWQGNYLAGLVDFLQGAGKSIHAGAMDCLTAWHEIEKKGEVWNDKHSKNSFKEYFCHNNLALLERLADRLRYPPFVAETILPVPNPHWAGI